MPKTTRKYDTEKLTTSEEGKAEYQRKYMRDYREYRKRKYEEMRKGGEAWEYQQAKFYVLAQYHDHKIKGYPLRKEALVNDPLPDHLEPLPAKLASEISFSHARIRHLIHEFLRMPAEDRKAQLHSDHVTVTVEARRWERDKRVNEAREWAAIQLGNAPPRLENGCKCMKILQEEKRFSFYAADRACRELFHVDRWIEGPSKYKFIFDWKKREAKLTEELESLEDQEKKYWYNSAKTLSEWADQATLLIKAGKTDAEIMELFKDEEVSWYHSPSKLKDMLDNVLRTNVDNEKGKIVNKQILEGISQGLTTQVIVNQVADLSPMKLSDLIMYVEEQRKIWNSIFEKPKKKWKLKV